MTLEIALLRVWSIRKPAASRACMTRGGLRNDRTGACGNELTGVQRYAEGLRRVEYRAGISRNCLRRLTWRIRCSSWTRPLRASIRVTRTWQNSKFVQDITLYAGLDRVDVVNDIDWHETHMLLKAAFPLAASAGMRRTRSRTASIERPTTRKKSGSKRNSKCRRCAGRIWATESTVSA